MLWFATLLGTLISTIVGLAILICLARSVGNRSSRIPLVLRTTLSVCMTAWVFVAAGNHGVGFAVLPAIAAFFMMILSPPNAADSWFGVFVLLQLFVFAGVFVYNSQGVRVTKAAGGINRPPLNKMLECFSAIAVLTTIFCVPYIVKASRPCAHSYNAKCYDNVDAKNAPLRFQLQLLDLETQKPIVGAVVRLEWATPQPRLHSKCVRSELHTSNAQGWVRSVAREPSWIPGDAEVIVPGYEAMRYYPNEQIPPQRAAQSDLSGDTQSQAPTQLSDFIDMAPDARSEYPAWEAAAIQLGYTASTFDSFAVANKYVKAFPLPSTQDATRLHQDVATGTGKLQYWRTARALPTPYLYERILGTICDGDASTEKLSKQAQENFQLALQLNAAGKLCDEKWDSVTNPTTVTPQLIPSVLQVFEDTDARARFVESNSSVRDRKLGFMETGPALTRSERLSFCGAIQSSLLAKAKGATEQR
jgi:hypothetical protein